MNALSESLTTIYINFTNATMKTEPSFQKVLVVSVGYCCFENGNCALGLEGWKRMREKLIKNRGKESELGSERR